MMHLDIRNLTGILLLLSYIGFVQAPRAEGAFSQPYVTSNFLYSSDIVGGGTQRIADNFTPTDTFDPLQGEDICVTWWGGFQQETVGPAFATSNFRIQFYRDNGSGLPETTPLTSMTWNVSTTGVDVVNPTTTWDVFRYTATLSGGGRFLSSGNNYWLSIVETSSSTNLDTGPGLWHWAAGMPQSVDGRVAGRQSDITNWVIPNLTTNRAFTLQFKGGGVVVPEPSSVAFMSLCGLFGWGYRRRHSKI